MTAKVRILVGDVRERLAELPDESVQCVVTSPPYWGLRDYSTEPQIWGGASDCKHEWGDHRVFCKGGTGQMHGLTNPPESGVFAARDAAQKQDQGCFCCLCDAWCGQLGLEPTIALYIVHMAEVFAEVRRVLRADGTLWLNMGDCYLAAAGNMGNRGSDNRGNKHSNFDGSPHRQASHRRDRRAREDDPHKKSQGLKPKDLVGQPWRLAFALQADGWYLRKDIIWAKGISFCESYSGSCMPESCRDRPTSGHEYLFLLTKRPRYFYDQEAVREKGVSDYPSAEEKRGKGWHKHDADKSRGAAQSTVKRDGIDRGHVTPSAGRNVRSVWVINPQAFPDAHFATFPERLVEPCVKAGTSEKGCCPECGAPWQRVVSENPEYAKAVPDGWTLAPTNWDTEDGAHRNEKRDRKAVRRMAKGGHPATLPVKHITTGWEHADCTADVIEDKKAIPCTVLDPFAGSGTTGLVAARLGRDAILIELHPEYAAMARARIEEELPLLVNLSLEEGKA